MGVSYKNAYFYYQHSTFLKVVLLLLLPLQSISLCVSQYRPHSFNTRSNFQTTFIQSNKSLDPTHPRRHHSYSSHSTILKMGLEINIRIVGRKNSIESTSFLQESYETYTKRLSSTITLYTTFHKSNNDLLKNLQTDSKKGYGIVCLDEKGDMYTSMEFSTKMYNWLEDYGSRLVFVIGAAEGLPPELKQYQYSSLYSSNQYSGSKGGSKKNKTNDSNGVLSRSPMFMSLSKMTFTHPWARTILVEQIYRASEIHKGTGYHKE